jgi:hypothetical protein
VPSQYKEHYNDSAWWDDEHYNDSARWDDEHYNDSAWWDDEHYNDTAWWDKQYNEQYNDFDAVGWAGEATDEGGLGFGRAPFIARVYPAGGFRNDGSHDHPGPTAQKVGLLRAGRPGVVPG